MIIVNINKDHHRIFLSQLIRITSVKCRIVWQKGEEYCLEPIDYYSYAVAKELQIKLSKYYNVPIV
jgi:hypothetical protein